MNLQLSPTTKRQIKARIESGEFVTAEKYLETLVRQDREREKLRKFEELLLKRLERSSSVVFDAADRSAIGKRVAKAIEGVRARKKKSA